MACSEPLSTELLSLRELARRVGRNVGTVRKWRDRDGLRVYSINSRSQFVLWSEFVVWLDERAVQNSTN